MLTVRVSPSTSGDVKIDNNIPPSYPALYSFTLNASVCLEAVPAPGYEFVNWSGSLVGSTNPEYVTMSCNKDITANFAPQAEPDQTASVSDFVWEDTNADGIQDADEFGIDNLTVNLFGTDDNLLGSTTTSGGGFYSFTSLQPGQYYLEFVIPEGYVFSPKDQGEDDMIDSDVDPAGQTDVLILAPDENDTTWDAGLYQTETASYDIVLVSGWNLISLPLIPESPNIEDLFAGITTNIEGVWSYDASTGEWHNYTLGAPPALTQMTYDTGYWVKVINPCTLTIRGRKPPLPNNISLFSDWNLVGLPFIAGPQAIEEILDGIMADIVTVWVYDASTGEWHNYTLGAPPVLTQMTHDMGYWVKVINPCTLTIERIAVDITTAEAYNLIQNNQDDSGFIILDVRTPEEYENGHIEKAVNLDYYSATFVDEIDRLNRNRTYLIYCRGGFRSRLTLETMRGLGFREVYNMLGGIIKWETEGFPIVQ